MIIAVDTSALAKLLVEEAESPRLRDELALGSAGGAEYAISTIAAVELRRLATRLGLDHDGVEPVIGRFHIVRLSEAVLQLAARLPHRHLDTLDAIHIATALAVEAEALVSYDVRRSEAAELEGLRVIAP